MASEATWGFSTWPRCTGWSSQPDQKSSEVALDLAWRGQAIRSGMLPGQANIAEQWPSQPELPAGGGHQARPTIGSGWVARADRGPAEGLFEKAEGMLDGETP